MNGRPLEDRNANEEMRQVLRVDFLIRKLELDLQPRGRVLVEALASLPSEIHDNNEHALRAAKRLRSAAQCLLAGAAAIRHRQSAHTPEGDVTDVAFNGAVRQLLDALNSVDKTAFRKREPFHHFVRSEGESVFTCLAGAASSLEEATEALGRVVPDLYERIDPKLLIDPTTSLSPREAVGGGFVRAQ